MRGLDRQRVVRREVENALFAKGFVGLEGLELLGLLANFVGKLLEEGAVAGGVGMLCRNRGLGLWLWRRLVVWCVFHCFRFKLFALSKVRIWGIDTGWTEVRRIGADLVLVSISILNSG